jgi:hypothetical protein
MHVRSIAGSAVLIACLFGHASISQAQDAPCKLPATLQTAIASKYPGARLLTSPDLSESDSAMFQKDHGAECPGKASLNFYGDGKPTLALVLILQTDLNEKADLIVAHEVGAKWETALLEEAGSSRPVVWSQGPGVYEDVYGEKKIRATKPVIVFCGYNSWAVLYAWQGSNVAKIWLRD